jgi:uroporphyrinogen-III synthase
VIRVGVTSDRFDAIAPGYADAGLEPVSLRCVQIQSAPPGDIAYVRDRATRADLLMITSPRVVSLLWPDGHMPEVDTAVVGRSTASSVEQAGGRVTQVGDVGLARLVELTAGHLEGRRVMIAHAEGSDPAAMARLRDIAPDLEEHPVYRAVPVAPGADPVDAVAFASPSAVKGWGLSRSFDDLVVGAIGATTAAAIARHREADVIAERPSHLNLAQTIASFMEVNV